MDNFCIFCHQNFEVITETKLSYAIYDKFPVSRGHILIIPRRHEPDFFNLTKEEQDDLWQLSYRMKDFLMEKYHPDGFNLGVNVGLPAGQTIFHVHIHLIPRYAGDSNDPAGGIRRVVTGSGRYCNNLHGRCLGLQ